MKKLKENALGVYGYADDIAILCANKKQLKKTINATYDWCAVNDFQVNQKKSGVLFYN